MTAPERIWAIETDFGEFWWSKQKYDGGTEYIRADLAAVQPAQVLDMIRREDALECFMGLDRIGDIKDAIAALEPQPDPRDAQIAAAMREGMRIAMTTPIEQVPEAFRAALAAVKGGDA